ncbi:MAG: hypothetical protein ABL967_11040 [Bryobacteraceae bacterium]
MFDFIELLRDKEFYYQAVVRSLADAQDDWDTTQRFRFATQVALNGNKAAKQAIYENYSPGPVHGEVIGTCFIGLDGVDGLLFAAKKMGALLQQDPEGVNTGWLLSCAEEDCGAEIVKNALNQAANTDPQIAIFLAHNNKDWKADSNRDLRSQLPSLSYAELLNKIPATQAGLLWSWGQKINEHERMLAARGLIAAQDRSEQLRHLRIFMRCEFPLSPEPLLDLVQVSEDRVGYSAVAALKNVRHPKVRALAFHLIESQSPWRGNAIELLIKNFEPGDHQIALQWFEAETDSEVLHSMEIDIRELWTSVPNAENEIQMLHACYERGLCSHCREFVVKRWINLGNFPDDLRAECEFDCNEDIRKLVGRPHSPARESGVPGEQ